jgi:hypothetical protein
LGQRDISVPNTARLGTPVTVSIGTFVGGCITPGRTEISQQGKQVDIYPIDIFVSGGCPDARQLYFHDASLVPSHRGLFTVRIHGTALSKVGDETQRHALIITRAMNVQ